VSVDAEHWAVRIRVDGPSGTACRVTRKSYRRAGGGSGGGAQPRADKTLNVQNYIFAVSQVANTSLRSVIGHSDMDELLSTERERVNTRVLEIIDAGRGAVGCQDRAGRGAGRLAAGGDETVHVTAGRSRAGAWGPCDHRRQ
jgi:hypothetical protein